MLVVRFKEACPGIRIGSDKQRSMLGLRPGDFAAEHYVAAAVSAGLNLNGKPSR
jgi:hypothetical protein